MDQVGFYYMDVSRCTVNKTQNSSSKVKVQDSNSGLSIRGEPKIF